MTPDAEAGTAVEGQHGIVVLRAVRHEYGPALEHRVDNVAGDFIFIEPGVPHEVCNLSTTDRRTEIRGLVLPSTRPAPTAR
jgi:uncharacterized RmlC-like cupin family protein